MIDRRRGERHSQGIVVGIGVVEADDGGPWPFAVLDATGMRIGELEALIWGDVDEPRHRRVSLLHLAGMPWARIGELVGKGRTRTPSPTSENWSTRNCSPEANGSRCGAPCALTLKGR
jgi:hypothetical protein